MSVFDNKMWVIGGSGGPTIGDQDDVWYPTKLELLLQEFELDPTISMVFSDADLIGEDGTRVGPRLWDTRLVGRTLRRHAVVPEELLARRALTTGCTMAIRRRVVEAALPFPDLMDDRRAIMRHDRWLSLVAAAVGTSAVSVNDMVSRNPIDSTARIAYLPRRTAIGDQTLLLVDAPSGRVQWWPLGSAGEVNRVALDSRYVAIGGLFSSLAGRPALQLPVLLQQSVVTHIQTLLCLLRVVIPDCYILLALVILFRQTAS